MVTAIRNCVALHTRTLQTTVIQMFVLGKQVSVHTS